MGYKFDCFIEFPFIHKKKLFKNFFSYSYEKYHDNLLLRTVIIKKMFMDDKNDILLLHSIGKTFFYFEDCHGLDDICEVAKKMSESIKSTIYLETEYQEDVSRKTFVYTNGTLVDDINPSIKCKKLTKNRKKRDKNRKRRQERFLKTVDCTVEYESHYCKYDVGLHCDPTFI